MAAGADHGHGGRPTGYQPAPGNGCQAGALALDRLQEGGHIRRWVGARLASAAQDAVNCFNQPAQVLLERWGDGIQPVHAAQVVFQ